MNKYKELGELIKKKRKANNLTQSQLAKKVKLNTSQFISNIERGISPIPHNKVDIFAKKLKISPQDIIFYKYNPILKQYGLTIIENNDTRLEMKSDFKKKVNEFIKGVEEYI